MAIRSRSMTALPHFRSHAFWVPGSPISVNRYGTPAFRNWKSGVHAASVAGATWPSVLVHGPCAVRVRYFRHQDRPKDVDNILKAILDGLDGKTGGSGQQPQRVLHDDRTVERVVSQRTDLKLHVWINGRGLHRLELAALIAARRSQASVFVMLDPPPDHAWGIGQ